MRRRGDNLLAGGRQLCVSCDRRFRSAQDRRSNKLSGDQPGSRKAANGVTEAGGLAVRIAGAGLGIYGNPSNNDKNVPRASGRQGERRNYTQASESAETPGMFCTTPKTAVAVGVGRLGGSVSGNGPSRGAIGLTGVQASGAYKMNDKTELDRSSVIVSEEAVGTSPLSGQTVLSRPWWRPGYG